MFTPINSEDRLVQKTIADYLHDQLHWDSVYAWNDETFGPNGMLGRGSEREVVLARDLREALVRLNPPYAPETAQTLVANVFDYVWHQNAAGAASHPFAA